MVFVQSAGEVDVVELRVKRRMANVEICVLPRPLACVAGRK